MVSDIIVLFKQLTYICSQFLAVLRAFFVVLGCLVLRLVVEPVEGLVSNYFSSSLTCSYLCRCERTAGARS